MMSDDVQPSTYIEYGVEYNDRDPKFKLGDHIKIQKCKKFFAKGCTEI